ncbi:MAG TPA: D-arabinono-1,4-lactone oxidase [Pseudonocardiaceae bacterium]|jgi:FAD-linked oxidoreductase|nr:D-arabinono-1,4-lactone oxidase [Pseudonocardiaceae bacterium]
MAADQWRNWAGTATANPLRWYRPNDPSQIAEVLKTAERDGHTVRVVGSGHSFTPVAVAEQLAIDLSEWSGIIAADARTGLVTARAGTTLGALNAGLDTVGLAMENLGDIDAQTIAGAISTGTHGTGARLGGLATQVEALELVLADGTLVSCSASERPELFAAARVGLGALGVISTVTLRCVPAFVLTAQEGPEPLEQVLEGFDEQAEANDHFEFYWFPYGRNALVKRNNRQPPGTRAEPLSPLRRYFEYEIMENQLFGLVCWLGRTVPPLARRLNQLSSAALSARSYSDHSHRVFVTSRTVRFVESEYAIPRAALGEVLGELRRTVPKLADPVMFPVEVRVAAADDIWLSTANGRDSAYLAIHQYLGMPYQEYFDLFESVVGAVGGRPHWGKMHSLDAERLRLRYPHFDDFRRVRAEVDPAGRFDNAYVRKVLGPR